MNDTIEDIKCAVSTPQTRSASKSIQNSKKQQEKHEGGVYRGCLTQNDGQGIERKSNNIDLFWFCLGQLLRRRSGSSLEKLWLFKCITTASIFNAIIHIGNSALTLRHNHIALDNKSATNGDTDSTYTRTTPACSWLELFTDYIYVR